MFFIGLLILGIHGACSRARQIGCEERGPLCGNDGKTYPNMCQLTWARHEDTDLAVLHEGSCNTQFQSATVPPVTEVDTGPEKVVTKVIKNPSVNYEKIKAIMPVGWPPLGPILVTPPRQDIEEREKIIT